MLEGEIMGVQDTKRNSTVFVAVLIFSLVIFSTVRWYEKYIYQIFNTNTYLTWHIGLEFMSVIMSFCIFFITFYTFERSYRLRTIIIASTFLSVGLLDTLHTLSYSGMPVFLTASSTLKATTFWIVARLTMSVGLLCASIIPFNNTVKLHRIIFTSIAIAYSAIVIYFITYRLDLFPPLFIEGTGLTRLKISLEYMIIGIQLVTMIFFIRTYIKEVNQRGYNFLIISLLFSIFSEMAFTLYSNVYDTYNFLGHIYKIASYYLLFKALFVINVHKPYLDLHNAERKISQYADNLEKLVEQRTAEITAANGKIMNDMDYARNIQSALLPSSFPKTLQLKFAARYIPCEKIGGDFYNVFKLDDENIGLLIGDVAGHGVSAAMITVFINQNIYIRREYDDGHVRVLSPKQVLNNLYHVYNRMTFPDEVYTVLFYGIYNLENRILTFCSAGLNTSPLILSSTGEIRPIEIEGLPICRLGPYINPSYENKSIQLNYGDSLILYTDGLIEIDRKKPDQFNEHNLMEFLRGNKDATASDIADQLIDAYYSILGNRNMIDDVTILVAKINELEERGGI